MIGQLITDPKTGEPIDSQGRKLSKSPYTPPEEVMRLFARCQRDFQVGWGLQRRPFDEFDGVSLLERTRRDQGVFAAFVGAEYVPAHKRWMWRGRKNTARNRIIGILAHMIAGMLYPMVSAKNEQSDEDKETARVMRILVEDALKKAKYEIKFLYMALSALVNPAVFVGAEWVDAIQLVKQKAESGKYEVKEVVDELLSGLNIHTIPVDEILLFDYYSGTGQIQPLPGVARVRRISYDEARSRYLGKFSYKGQDLFDFVEAGRTRVLQSNDDGQTLFDVEWTEADPNFVQEVTFYYRAEDIKLTWVAGVGMFDYDDPYNSNPFTHRRMTLVDGKWMSVPVVPIAMSGFEPIDPAGRFAWYKSAAFKEYWDALGNDRLHQDAFNAVRLDTIKPLFISGAGGKTDGVVVAPGGTTGLPANAKVEAFSMGPNIAATMQMMQKEDADMSESTQDKISSGITTPGVTATATVEAANNGRKIIGLFSTMMASLVEQVGGFTVDALVMNVTVGQVDMSVPEALAMKYKTILSKGKDKGRDVTHKIVFDGSLVGRDMTPDEMESKKWELYDSMGEDGEERESTDQRIWLVNPYRFARNTYSLRVDSDQMVMKGMGTDQQRDALAFQMLSDPRVLPFTDQKNVVDDFVIEKFGGNDPDRYKRKDSPETDLLNSVMGQPGQASAPGAVGGKPGTVGPGQPAPMQAL